MRKEKYGFGIIGCGVISPIHAQAIQSIPNAELKAVCDLDAGKAQALAGRFHCDWATEYPALLERADIDVVHVLTWSGTHADIGMDAARAGKHIVVTKPVDIRLEKIDALIQVCREHGVKLAVTHQFRSYPVYRQLKEAIDSGHFGRLILGNAFVKWWRDQDYYDSASWRGTWEYDGGCLMNQSIHYVDLLLWLMGPVDHVSGFTDTRSHKMEAEDVATACVHFNNGAQGIIQGTTSAFQGLPARLEIHGERGNAIVEGEKLIYCDAAGGCLVAGKGGTHTAASSARANLAAAVPAHAEQIADLIAAIEEDRAPLIPGEEARKSVELVLAIYRAAHTDGQISLPLGSLL
ncbi:MAG TPA: Gfo/Idh/MocA family oxidoreductase [Armatimonadota bacterium]|nr:Gfo/Idh/MocA family oxidoreductase [Armatimonadota bacterium]